MDAPVLVAVISAAAGIFASALTFFLTKRKEHQAEWRKQKLESYKELLSAMSGVAVKQPSVEARSRFAHTTNHIMLVAAPPVLVALRALLDEISQEGGRHDEFLTELMYSIREDLGIKPNRAGKDFLFKLSAAGQSGT
jgi:hypothetical protein